MENSEIVFKQPKQLIDRNAIEYMEDTNECKALLAELTSKLASVNGRIEILKGEYHLIDKSDKQARELKQQSITKAISFRTGIEKLLPFVNNKIEMLTQIESMAGMMAVASGCESGGKSVKPVVKKSGMICKLFGKGR